MCGIVGYVGQRPALPFLIDALCRLEYRGYDSAGVSVLCDGHMATVKTLGRLKDLQGRLAASGGTERLSGSLGIGHTRWATHGVPSDVNAHPHGDCRGRVTVVHNGVIENHAGLRAELAARGHVFASTTDTEVVPHLVEEELESGCGLVEAVRRTAARLEGSFALVVAAAGEPGRVVVVRQSSPIIVGLGQGENYVASDIPAVLNYTRRVVVLDDGDIADVTASGVAFGRFREGTPCGALEKPVLAVEWDAGQAERGGYEHFMRKEIYEQPAAVRETLRGRIDLDRGAAALDAELGLDAARAARFGRAFVVACGTAYHAGLVGRDLLEGVARLPVTVELASEFLGRDPLIGPGDLLIAVSQSGETADTRDALREARRRGAYALAICNVVGSSVAREADATLFTRAGPEVAVAATKTFTAQLVAFALLAAWLAQARGRGEAARRLVTGLLGLPDLVQQTLDIEPRVKELATRLSRCEDIFFIGRGLDFALVQEGQLKLKEISYIHAEAYAAGELKHGALALITSGVPVIAVLTQPSLYDKMDNNMQQVRARGGHVIAVAAPGNPRLAGSSDEVLYLPDADPLLAPVLAAVPLQLLAYHCGVIRGCDVDKPRNLAKSVTVP
jgi:glucosamine--fructose-6-phosphate aminotransferase (isomerizing)